MARDYAKTIGALIAMAEDEANTQEARQSYRDKAETLMREYRVSEEEAIAQDSEAATKPRRFDLLIMTGSIYAPMRYEYMELFREVAKHAGIQVHFEWAYPNDDRHDGKAQLWARGYGYDIDIRLAEFLWTAAHLTFITRIDARVNPQLSDQENCYYLRNSGQKRNDIAHWLWGSGYKDGAAHGKVQKLYMAECAKRGEEPRVSGRGIQVDQYRKAYASSFLDEFGWRLRSARDAADAVSGALILSGRKERIEEAYYAEWPDRRPAPPKPYVRPEVQPCDACARTKSPTGQCRNCRPRVATEADRRRWNREINGPEARAGRAAGAAAARSINVQRTAEPRAQRTDAAPERTALGR